jgi:hypothetical protein
MERQTQTERQTRCAIGSYAINVMRGAKNLPRGGGLSFQTLVCRSKLGWNADLEMIQRLVHMGLAQTRGRLELASTKI